MPLADKQGQIGESGRITCQTCHLAHGRTWEDDSSDHDPDQFNPDWLRAVKPMIRPYTAPNLCSSCHGLDGLRRFLYYHVPSMRRREDGQNQNQLSPGDQKPTQSRTDCEEINFFHHNAYCLHPSAVADTGVCHLMR
jgi:hypothetical protein